MRCSCSLLVDASAEKKKRKKKKSRLASHLMERRSAGGHVLWSCLLVCASICVGQGQQAAQQRWVKQHRHNWHHGEILKHARVEMGVLELNNMCTTRHHFCRSASQHQLHTWSTAPHLGHEQQRVAVWRCYWRVSERPTASLQKRSKGRAV